MRALLIGLIALALLAAGGTAFLVKRFLDTRKDTPVQADTTAPVSRKLVVVADRDLPAGTVLNTGLLDWRFWPEDQIKSEYVSANEKNDALVKKFVGTVVRRGIAAGTPMTDKLVFKQDKSGFLAGALDPGMRAVAVAVSATTGASGFILPGDRVDVILTFEVSRSSSLTEEQRKAFQAIMLSRTGETIIEDIRVVAVDQKFDDFEEKAAVAKTVTLEVTPRQAEMLSVATAMGKISLALRSQIPGEKTSDKPPFVTDLQVSPTLRGVLGEEANKAKKAATETKAKAARRPAPGKPAPTVKIFRGGTETTQEFKD